MRSFLDQSQLPGLTLNAHRQHNACIIWLQRRNKNYRISFTLSMSTLGLLVTCIPMPLMQKHHILGSKMNILGVMFWGLDHSCLGAFCSIWGVSPKTPLFWLLVPKQVRPPI